MNLHNEWDTRADCDQWTDGTFVSKVAVTSPPATPPDSMCMLIRLFLAGVILAGLAGGLFQAYTTSLIVAKIVGHPHSTFTTTHQHSPQKGTSR
jgi:hypothetical protein